MTFTQLIDATLFFATYGSVILFTSLFILEMQIAWENYIYSDFEIKPQLTISKSTILIDCKPKPTPIITISKSKKLKSKSKVKKKDIQCKNANVKLKSTHTITPTTFKQPLTIT